MDGKSVIEVSRGALEGNLAELRRVLAEAGAGEAAVLGVVKANGYGHGAALCGPVLAAAGAEWLGVTDVAEGVEVRAALREALGEVAAERVGVLVMSGLEACEAEAEAAVAWGLTPVVWFREQAEVLRRVARRMGRAPVAVHVEVDTGMSRQGVRVEEVGALLEAVRGEVRVDGVMTHFASSEVVGAEVTERQRAGWVRAMAAVGGGGVRPGWLHAGNSSTVDDGRLLPWVRGWAERTGARMRVRAGLALWGYVLPLESATGNVSLDGRLAGLRPVGRWVTRVLDVREVRAGETVGYNATFRAERRMRVGLLPVGYADGVRRELSSGGCVEGGGGYVVVRGRRCAVAGRVSMNLMTVDLTELPEVGRGEVVELLGPGWDAAEAARCAGTIPYEILCAMRGERRLVG